MFEEMQNSLNQNAVDRKDAALHNPSRKRLGYRQSILTNDTIVQALVAQIPWRYNFRILE